MTKNPKSGPYVPRIVPRPSHMRALSGPWTLGGEVVRLAEEPETGVLIAVNQDGHRLNPLKVITRGQKLPTPERDSGGRQH